MAIRLMSLRGVPDDELNEICSLFDEHALSYYVTPPGNWHISAGGLWLDDQNQLEKAYALLNSYQQQRNLNAREEFEKSLQKGEQMGIVDRIFMDPLRYLGYLFAIGFILYLSLMPFLDFGKN